MKPFAVQASDGVRLSTPIKGSAVVLADTLQTNGSLTVLELEIAAYDGPAAHTHLREDEVWYVLDGDFRFKAGDEMLRATTGGMAFGPRGVPHAFQNIGDTVGRLLIITTPSGLERFFEQAGKLSHPVDPEELAAIGRANWLEFGGPPLAVSDPL
ncbi:cupin domain [Kribbella rubisoli]|uniref:Cupin domain n=1 Tax=Kribbella rubisoli TaxID=3075929 RepID=A0A4Q7WQC9_9ACTN|nr:cupin domain-containing protein [Kribbella rubisoli]RZU12073.1 cupin domain [Kribbella rubisoli]